MSGYGLTRDRVVAVVVALADGTEQVSSGYLVGDRVVLTAEHATRNKDTTPTAARVAGARVVQIATGATAELDGTPLADLDLDVAVLALTLPVGGGWPREVAPVEVWGVDRATPGVLADCAVIGLPRFAYDPSRGLRGTAELHGTIHQTDGAETGHLLLREPIVHGVADPVTGRAGWGGLSGALVFYQGRALGVVVEHHPHEGDNSVRLIGFDKIAANPALRAALGLPEPPLPPARAVIGQLPAPAGPVVAGPIPVEPVGFVYREQQEQVEEAVDRPGVVVLVGLPGTGKSQIAGAVARDRVAGGWPLVGWVPAQTRDSLLAGLAEIAGLVGVADPEGDSQRSAQRLRDHLQGRTEPGLLVLDNVTDPQLVRDLLPATGPTRVLISSTETAVSGLGALIEVRGFPRPASINYLTGRTGRDDPAGADALAGELDDLPVALAQAAATLVGPPPVGYRDLLEEIAALPVEQTLQWRPGQDYPRPVAAALLLSVQTAEQADTPDVAELTSRLLRVAALLDPAGIDPGLFTGLAPDTLPPVKARRVLRDAQARCLSRGLLTATDPGAGDLRWVMHRLVARVLRDRDTTQDTLTDSIAEALDLLEPRRVPPEQAWTQRSQGDTLVGHIQSLTTAAASVDLDPDLAQRLLDARAWAARHLYETADLARAIPLYQQTLADTERVLGGDHPQTLTSRNNLAYARAVAGIPADDAALVDYWLATPTWGESFAVLDAAEARLRATTVLADRAEAGDPAAIQHNLILRAVALLPRQTVYAAVTNPNAALSAAAAAGNAGQYNTVGLILGLNPEAGNHPAGIAVYLTALGAAADPDLPQIARQVIDAGIAPDVLDALPQIAELLDSEAMQTAVTAVVVALTPSPQHPAS